MVLVGKKRMYNWSSLLSAAGLKRATQWKEPADVVHTAPWYFSGITARFALSSVVHLAELTCSWCRGLNAAIHRLCVCEW